MRWWKGIAQLITSKACYPYKMDFLLDSLFITLVVICVILLFRLIRSKLLYKHRRADLHPVVLPFKKDVETDELTISYELPYQSPVRITLLDENDQELSVIFEKDQKEGNYFLRYQLAPVDGKYIQFTALNFKMTRKV